jgi:hypothetical protein
MPLTQSPLRLEAEILSRMRSAGTDGQKAGGDGLLGLPWRKTMSTMRREIVLPEGTLPHQARPMRSETRATLVAAIARGTPLAP